ncbi:hypothetical protein F511_35703 [Dorcoceras hygrometricum]|uniref:Uncharacterized protein n=1 Tax=Dorcoceras hygrometricum TaxID=472368 RepID=A0A2Z7C6Q2_9LAMI|nr:hypothetical protein F511_35703 [Dorcoceras hygrometricum]
MKKLRQDEAGGESHPERLKNNSPDGRRGSKTMLIMFESTKPNQKISNDDIGCLRKKYISQDSIDIACRDTFRKMIC